MNKIVNCVFYGLSHFLDYLFKRLQLIKYGEQLCKDAIDPIFHLTKEEFKMLYDVNNPTNFVLSSNEVYDLIVKKYSSPLFIISVET